MIEQTEGAPLVARRGPKEILKSYFFWTYARGNLHYDILVTLILLFIFITPHLWNYGDTPPVIAGPSHSIQVSGDGGRGLIITVPAADVKAPAGAPDALVKKALREAIEPVTGDAVFVNRWEMVTDAQGKLCWKVWAHR
jgi:hypothetical protein